MKEIDARKLACPKPVILTKKELDAMETGVVCTLVDNKVATENLSRLAESMGLKATVEEVGEDYTVTINKDHAVEVKADDDTF
ncbi:MAG: sulfurtransferase TusA family protein, partial [Fenollaria timonensis]